MRDTFDFDANWGIDTIFDLELGIDRINLGGISHLNSFADLTVIDASLNTLVSDGAGAIFFIGITAAQTNTNSSYFEFV